MRTLLPLLLPLAACTEADPYEGEIVKDEDGKADTSAAALFVDFEFDGQLLTDSSWNAENTIEDQLLYTIGQLNGRNSVGRLDKVVLTNVVCSYTRSCSITGTDTRPPTTDGRAPSMPATTMIPEALASVSLSRKRR